MGNDVLLKYIEGEATEEEALLVIEWIDKDATNLEQYILLRRVYEASLWGIPRCTNTHLEQFSKRKVFKEYFKVAVFVAIGFFSFYCYDKLSSKPVEEILTAHEIIVPEGQRAEVNLSDGSKVWVNANSTLVLSSEPSGQTREIYLEGEAYFDIAHDDNNRFVVNTQNYQLKVFGTQFNVKSFSAKKYFETGLVEGSLEVNSKVQDDRVLLVPNECVFAYETQSLTKKNIDVNNYLWKEGILYFNELTLEKIFEKLEQYYDVEINVNNTDILSNRFTGKFWISDGIDQVLNVLRMSQDFEYTKTIGHDGLVIEINS